MEFKSRRFKKIHLTRPALSHRQTLRIRYLKLKIFSSISNFFIFGSITTFIAVVFLLLWYSRELPVPDKIKRREGFTTVILDRNNKPIYDIYSDKNRIPIPWSDIPQPLKQATIAIEDKDFYKHGGFDIKGIMRAFFKIITFQGLQGGSTLTQQLVKNVLLSSERTLPRKFKEFILAVQIEKKYSKDEILQMYLNEAPYGGTMWGIEAASQGYFGKSTKDLTFIESVILAGLPQRPTYFSPYGDNPAAYVARGEEVLRRMREEGYILQTQEAEVKRLLAEINFATHSSQFKATHFTLFIKKQLEEKFGEKVVEIGGLKVVTTLDLPLQEKAENIVKEELKKIEGLNVSNAAVLITNPQTGEILTYIGSREYDSTDSDFQGKFDVVRMGLRQPGSALKPITYAVAFNKGYTPSTLIMDLETHFPGGSNLPDYKPANYDGKFRGPIQIRYALGNSINIPAVKMTALIGIGDILKTAYEMGITNLRPTKENIERLGLSITLGGGEVSLYDLTSAYSVLANGGLRKELYAINKVTDTSGKVLYEHKEINGKRVLSKEISFLISDILADNGARKEVFGERSYLSIPGHTVAVKTGTTDDKRDNWTIGYSNSVVAGVWVGNNDNSAMDPRLSSGATGAAPIWNRIIKEALKNKTDEVLAVPENIISLDIDTYGGGLAKPGQPTRKEFFIKGTEPTNQSAIYKKLKLSKADEKKLANIIEIATGNYIEKEFLVFSENDPTAGGGINRWQEAIDEWTTKQEDEKFHPPAETSNINDNQVVVQIKSPANSSRINGNTIEIRAGATAVKLIKKMELYIDGVLKTSIENDQLSENLKLDNGPHRLKVKAYDENNNSGENEIIVGINAEGVFPSPTSVTPTIAAIPIL